MFLKRLKHIRLDDSIWLLIAYLVSIAIVLAFFVPTHWATWIHWSWLAIAGHFFGIALAVVFVWTLSFGFAELLMKDERGAPIKRSRFASYLVCVMAVLCGAVLFGLMAGSAVEPGDEEEWSGRVATEYHLPMPLHKRDALIEDVFLFSLAHSLAFAVRSALNRKKSLRREHEIQKKKIDSAFSSQPYNRLGVAKCHPRSSTFYMFSVFGSAWCCFVVADPKPRTRP